MNFVTSIPDSFNPSDCSPEQLLHDLQVRQVDLEFKLIELEVQNEHLRSTQTQHEQSDGYYADLFNNAPVGHLTLTENELISEANIAATEFFGIERHNLLSRRFASLVAADHGDRWYLLFAQLIKHNQAVDIELTLKNNQGRQLPVQLNCLSVNATVRISITDISNIKQAETVLRDVEETVAIQTERLQPLKAQEDLLCRFQEIARSVPGVIYQYRLRPDGSSCIPYASDALFDFFRLRPEEVREDASKAYALIHPDDCEGFIASIQASARDLTPWYYEYRIKFDDGTVRWLLANSRPQREADGSTLWHGFTTDITERKQMEQSLRESEARWRFAIEGSGDGVWDRNMQTNQVEYSNRWKEMFGYSENDPLPTDQDWKNNIHPDDLAYVTGLLKAYSKGMSPSISTEYRMRCKDNSYKWILSRSKVVNYDEEGQPLRMVGIHTDISEHRQAEADLRKHKSQLHEAMRIAKMGNWQMDFATGHIAWSEEIYDLLGLSPAVSPPDYSEQQTLFTAESWGRANTALALIQETGVPFQLELEMIRSDNAPLWVIVGGEVIQNANGTLCGLHGMIQDITERRLSDQVLNQLKAMVDISLDGFYIVDQKGQLTQVNAAYAQMLGYSAEELTGMHLNQLDAIEDDEQIKAHIEKVIEQGFDFFETRQFHKNGHEIELEVSVSYLADYQRFCVFCRDITQRKTMELALKLSESKFRSIINASPIAMALVNTSVKQAEFVFLSPSFVKTFGYDLAESSTLEEWNSKAYPDPDYRARVKAMEQKLRESEHDDITPLEITICCKDNSYKTVLASYTSIDNDSKAMGLVVLYDITDRKQVEAQYNSIFNASVEGIITVNIDNIVVASNPAVETIFGYSADELVNGTLQKLLPSLSDNSHKLSLDYPQPLIVKIQEIRGLHKNGHLITLDLTIADYTIDNNAYFTYIVRDITERKHREQQHKDHLDQLAHVGRLGLMGEMASGMAHEVNQPLTAIATYAQVSLNLIKKEKPDLQKLIEIAVKTQEQALRAGHIIHGMKRFCKSKAQQRSIININELINNSVKLCADQLKQNRIVVTFKLEEPLPVINVDPIQIEQVLINLIRNGADAILSATEKIQRKITIHSQLTPNHEIKVSVQDNGSGIPDDQREKILMPFHTSKSEGMGMGLSISSALIEAHNGKLNFESHFGKGSTFYFTLPI